METYLMSNQAAFDHVATKLWQQGERCVDGSGACLYGDGHGRHCAIGWILPDNPDYMGFMGDSTMLFDHFDELAARFQYIEPELLIDLQRAHDNECSWDDGRNSLRATMREVAAHHGLNTTVLDALG